MESGPTAGLWRASQRKFLTSDVLPCLIFQRRVGWNPSVSIPNYLVRPLLTTVGETSKQRYCTLFRLSYKSKDSSRRYLVLRASLSIHQHYQLILTVDRASHLPVVDFESGRYLASVISPGHHQPQSNVTTTFPLLLLLPLPHLLHTWYYY